MLFQTCTKLTFDLSCKLVITVIARNRINSVGSLFFSDRILRFGENMPLSLKRFLSNFNLVAIHTGLIVDQVRIIFRLESQYPKYLVIHLHGVPRENTLCKIRSWNNQSDSQKKENMISAMLSWWKGKNEEAVSIIMSVIRGATTRIRNWDVYSVRSTWWPTTNI